MGVAALAAVAALLLFWRLDAVYLWQDEANTAVLAKRMLDLGKPLGYDGVNLVANDNFASEDPRTIDARTRDAKTAVDYVIRRGDLRADGAWIYHPWGQFVAAAAGIRALGPTTLGARLPFALAAFATVLALYWLVRATSADSSAALMAATLLVANGAWILHGRQARYYALSSLAIVLVLLAFERWQRGARWGAIAFVAAAWCFFQVDYGTVWPVLGVLLAAAFLGRGRALRETLLVCFALAATILPFVAFYEMGGRQSAQLGSWGERFVANAFNVNQYVIPILALAMAAFALATRWSRCQEAERRMAAIAIAVLAALALWIPTVAPAAFLRYTIVAAPLGAMVTAGLIARLFPASPARMWAAAAIVAATTWLALPFETLTRPAGLRPAGVGLRPELGIAAREVFVARKDPNAALVEWLRRNAAPSEEILVNYEDLPLMYYLPNPIRGGIAAFRAEDVLAGPPSYLVLRRTVRFVHWPVYRRVLEGHDWERIPLAAPDVVWGNNPDPLGKIQDPDRAPDLFIARRRGP